MSGSRETRVSLKIRIDAGRKALVDDLTIDRWFFFACLVCFFMGFGLFFYCIFCGINIWFVATFTNPLFWLVLGFGCFIVFWVEHRYSFFSR